VPPTEQRSKYIRLDYLENTIGCSKKVTEAIRGLNEDFFSIYPNYAGLDKAIAIYSRVNEKEVLVTNGSDEAISLVFEGFLEEGDKAVLVEPTFSMFRTLLQQRGAEIKTIKMYEDFGFPKEEVISELRKGVKLLVLCNPNNPTGTKIRSSEIEYLLQQARGAVVLVDEAYFEFFGETMAGFIGKYNNLVITRTFSKAFGLAALRAGYIISNPVTIAALRKIAPPFGVNAIAVLAIKTALSDMKFLEKYVKSVKRNRETLRLGLLELGISTTESTSNFVLAKVKNAALTREILKRKGILVKDVSGYPMLENRLRITVGTKKQNDLLINCLGEMEKKALIFDMDGVLVDVSQSYRVAIKRTAEDFVFGCVGFDEIQSYKEKVGYNNDWDLTEAIIQSRGKSVSKQQIIDRFQAYYLGGNFDGLIANEKWMADNTLLEGLSKKYKLAVFTGRPRAEAEFALKLNNAQKYFSVLVAMEDVAKQKPDPEGIYKTLAKLGVVNGVYFGDTINDEVAAKTAGVGFVLVKDNVNEVIKLFLEERK